MRYLSKFKMFEADGPLDPSKWSWTKDLTIPRDMQMDIYDMSFELRDEGYNVTYQWWPPYEKSNKLYKDNKYPHINITKTIQNEEGGLEKIYYGWIEDFCQRVVSYLDEKDYNAAIKFRKLNSNEYIDIENMKWEPFSDKPMAISIHFRIEMISRKVYGDVYESMSKEITDYIKDINISLNDIKLKIRHQEQKDKIVMYISNDSFTWSDKFSLADIREEVEHLISYMEDSGHELLNAKWMISSAKNRSYWKNLYKLGDTNRFGSPMSKDFFDIEGYNSNEKNISSLELVFSN